ncbi:MAG: glycosyltransferase family 2 protein [bacterium]
MLLNLLYLFLLVASFFEMRRQTKLISLGMHKELSRSLVVPGISIIVPAYNEEATIAESITSLLQLDYPIYGIIVVNDGSKDNTLDVLKKSFSLRRIDKIYRKSIQTKPINGAYVSPKHANLIVIDKENGGKADALNCGINISSHPYFCAIDSDAVLEKDSILRIMREIQESPETIVAAGGIVRIANGCTIKNGQVLNITTPRNSVVNFQIVEYLRSYLCGRTGFSIINGLLIISGAFGIFNKQVVKEVGGYLADTVGEDMELVVRLHRYLRDKKRDYKIVYANDPICWTEAPESLKILSSQRNRWQRGLIETMSKNMGMLFNPRYGVIGFLSMPFFIFGEMLASVIELIGLITTIAFFYLGYIDYSFLLVFFLLTVIFGLFLSWSSILLEELNFHKYTKSTDLIKLIFYSIIETFGYRQLNSWWRLKGFIDLLRKKKDWGTMTRKGFAQTPAGEATLERI